MNYFSDFETTKTNRGLENVPNEEQRANIEVARGKMNQIREALEKVINVNSWFRSEAVNTAVGGAKNSGHLTGFCVDCWVKGMTNEQLCDFIDDLGVEYDQLIDEFNGQTYWVHISFDPRNRGQRLVARKRAGKMHYTEYKPRR